MDYNEVIHLRGLIDEDFVNYKLPSMFLITPYCDFKCDKEYGTQICQNLPVINEPIIEISFKDLLERYNSNEISKAIVIGGLEPFHKESYEEVRDLISYFRWNNCFDPIIIYTGYDVDEVLEEVLRLVKFANVFVKFGRYIPNQESHYDELLGVQLSSPNQYAVEI